MTPATGQLDGAAVLAAVDDPVAAVAVARAAGETALTRGVPVVLVVPVASPPSPAIDRTPPTLVPIPRSIP